MTNDELAALQHHQAEVAHLIDQADEHCRPVVLMLMDPKWEISTQIGIDPFVVTIVTSLLAKGVKTFRSIQSVCAAGYGQDALVLLRGLFETTSALLFILQGFPRRRARMLAAHEAQRRLVMCEQMKLTKGLKRFVKKGQLETAKKAVDEYRKLCGTNLVQAVRKYPFGFRLEVVAKKLDRKHGWSRFYNLLYRHASASVHVADVSDHLLPGPPTQGPTLKLLPGDAHVVLALNLAGLLLLASARRVNERLGLVYSSQLDPVFKSLTKTIKS